MRVLAVTDKFRGTASAAQACAAIADTARRLGHEARAVPLSDGGEGLLDVFGGANRMTEVTGPLGTVVTAGWRLMQTPAASLAIIESARASGLLLAGGADGNDPMAATSRGTGELLDAAVAAGADRVIVGLGGSASTDGGLGALDALTDATLRAIADLRVEVVLCCDVRALYTDAARIFGPQKGATGDQVAVLTDRLHTAAQQLRAQFGVDVTELPGAGAAGGLAGGLAAAGAGLRPGFDLVAEHVGLDAAVRGADLVITGEGCLDASSLDGKVVGGVVGLARDSGVRVAAVVGSRASGTGTEFLVYALDERFGMPRAMGDTLACIAECTADLLTR